MRFRPYYFDQQKILPMSYDDAKLKADEIYNLEQILRVTIEKLKITEWIPQ
jgi:hypothetical protein